MALLRSPVFVICLLLFIGHQVLQLGFKMRIGWMDNYLDNLVAMPVILTLLTFERRWLFKKGDQYCLPIIDVVIATVYIIVIAEIVFPLLSPRFTGDWYDILFYIAGSLLFYFTINRMDVSKNRSN